MGWPTEPKPTREPRIARAANRIAKRSTAASFKNKMMLRSTARIGKRLKRTKPGCERQLLRSHGAKRSETIRRLRSSCPAILTATAPAGQRKRIKPPIGTSASSLARRTVLSLGHQDRVFVLCHQLLKIFYFSTVKYLP